MLPFDFDAYGYVVNSDYHKGGENRRGRAYFWLPLGDTGRMIEGNWQEVRGGKTLGRRRFERPIEDLQNVRSFIRLIGRQ